jgi:hypothetical protein
MTRQEKEQLAFYRSPEGEREWRVSDLAYAHYQNLERLEYLENKG